MTARAGERDHDRVQHILDAADKLAEIVAEGREAYDTNWRQRDIAERRLLIIGEAAGQLSEGFVAAHPALEIRKAKDMRNILVHAYDNVDPDLVWDAIAFSVPKFAAVLRSRPDIAAPEPGAEKPDLNIN